MGGRGGRGKGDLSGADSSHSYLKAMVMKPDRLLRYMSLFSLPAPK